MKEDFLQYVWRMGLFDPTNLQTTAGERVEIIQKGMHNTDAGPDFLQAQIIIGDTRWAGNVEIHLHASEWNKHQHQNDKAYNNVILHVVLDEDEPVNNQNGNRIPCLELKNRIPKGLENKYLRLMNSEYWIPCQHQFHQVAAITKNSWLDRLLVERIEGRLEQFEERLSSNKNNWEETFYLFLVRAFGLKVNNEPFERLALSLPLNILLKHKNNLFQMEALLFGQAGLLGGDFRDEYPQSLQKEYQFLRKKYQLTPLPVEMWRFMRMRPANFPTIRIAQIATLIYQTEHLFSKILAARNIDEFINLFQLRLSHYWKNHYIFDKESPSRKKTLGKQAIQLLVINTVAPFVFLYGVKQGDDQYKDKALDLLASIPPEKNKIINEWGKLGMEPASAYQTQALLQLKKAYCDRKRCVECSIGHQVLKQ